MSKMVKKILHTVAATLALSACQPQNIDEVLLSRSDISLTMKGELQMAFDENVCQLGYNTGRNEFRVYDEKLANYFILRCSAKPTSEGQVIKATLEYTTSGNTKTLSDLEFTVEKTSSDDLIWLWNRDKQIGIVVKSL